MALVARANAAAADGDPRALKRLTVQFRGMGVPEEEIVVTGTVARGRRGGRWRPPRATTRIIRNAEADEVTRRPA